MDLSYNEYMNEYCYTIGKSNFMRVSHAHFMGITYTSYDIILNMSLVFSNYCLGWDLMDLPYDT